MKQIPVFLLSILLIIACSKSRNTRYDTPSSGSVSARLIKFAYSGNIYGILPIYQGLADTPNHRFEGNGITESDFVTTRAGDTILITILLSDKGAYPVVTAVEDNTQRTTIDQQIQELPAGPDASSRFRIIVR